MLTSAALVVTAAVLLGVVLAVLAMREEGGPPPLWLALGHGLLALAGFGLLVAALQIGPVRGLETGTSSFGTIALIVLALAGVVGIAIFVLHLWRRRLPAALVGVHGMLAVIGAVILAAYLFVG